MKEQSNLKSNKIMIIAAGVVLSLDLIMKLTGLPFPSLAIVNWLATVVYPIVAGYVLLLAFTFTEADVTWIRN
jgi:hypothetical protein